MTKEILLLIYCTKVIMRMINIPAYCGTELITAVKSFMIMDPGAFTIKYFIAILIPYHNKLVFVTVGYFNPSQIFTGKGRSLP
jgi:hypothetical protein